MTAIESAVKLGTRFRQAFIQNVANRPLTLPLPDFNTAPSPQVAQDFFETNPVAKELVAQGGLLAELHDLQRNGFPTPQQTAAYLDYYRTVFAAATRTDVEISPQGMVVMLTLRQWNRGEGPRVKGLQLVAGTLLEIGVDYINQHQGAFFRQSKFAPMLEQFFLSIDDLEFATGDFKAVIFQQVAPQLMLQALELTSGLTEAQAHDGRVQSLIKTTARAVADDLGNRITQLTTAQEQQVLRQWGQMVFRSVVFHATTTVVGAAPDMLARHENQKKLVDATGQALLDVLFNTKAEGIALHNLFTGEALDKVVQAAMGVVAENPVLISRKDGLQQVIAATAGAVSKSGIQKPGLIPELSRLVLQKTGENLHLMWKVEANTPQIVLLNAAQSMLAMVAANPGGISLSHAQVMLLVEDALDTIVANPDWVHREGQGPTPFDTVMQAVMKGLAAAPSGARLQFDTLRQLVKACLQAAALRTSLLAPVASGQATLLEVAIKKLTETVFPANGGSNLPVGKATILLAAVEEFLHKAAYLPADLSLADAIANELKASLNALAGNQSIAPEGWLVKALKQG
jgi:hypothetical protein